MAGQLVECVPNFSEGRDAGVVRAIEQAIASGAGVLILRTEMDPDHNRSVITFAAPPEAVGEAAFRGIAKAAELIDLRKHSGVHPRIGATDVVPFVPLSGVTMQECVRIAHRTGEAVWQKLGIPVYFYEAAARDLERAPLENCRRGGFEHSHLAPDLGGPSLHPSVGACVIGARKLLIAFNVKLDTADLAIAKHIARKVRASGGGLANLKALGVLLASQGVVQVSMNLTDFERTPLHAAFSAVAREAGAQGVGILDTEIVGLVPKRAFEEAAAHFLRLRAFHGDLILENRLASVQPGGDLAPLLADLARPRCPKAGGSAAAATGALASALASKLCGLVREPERFREDAAFFTAAIDRDAEAFRATVREGKSALAHATQVPIEIAERARALADSLAHFQVPEKIASDRDVAVELARAACRGAAAVARANLAHLDDGETKSAFEERLRAIE